MRLPGLPVALPVALAVALAASPAAPSAAAPVQADGATRVVDCHGEVAVVEGSGNSITFGGLCVGLRVRGDRNALTVALSAGAPIDVQGDGNRIRYLLAPPPPLRVLGSGTELTAVELPSPPGDTITLAGDGQRLDLDCAGRDVLIRANRADYTLRGGCRSVRAQGSFNRLHAELRPESRVVIDGSDTILVYAVLGPGAPTIRIQGERSRADDALAGADAPPATPAAAAPANPPQALPDPPPEPAAGADVPLPLPPPPVAPEPPPPLPEPPQAAPRLADLLQRLHASVAPGGTLARLPAEALFAPGSDILRPEAEPLLQSALQLATAIRPSAVRAALADAPDLAPRRLRAAQGWFAAHGLTVEADPRLAVPAGGLGLMLAR